MNRFSRRKQEEELGGRRVTETKISPGMQLDLTDTTFKTTEGLEGAGIGTGKWVENLRALAVRMEGGG